MRNSVPSCERHFEALRIAEQPPRKRGHDFLVTLRNGGEVSASQLPGQFQRGLTHLLEGGSAQMGRVVEWAVVVRTVRQDARVVALQARLHERSEVGVVRQRRGDCLGARVGRCTGRLRQHIEEFPVRRRHPKRDRGSAGTARLVIEHDGGAETFRTLTDECLRTVQAVLFGVGQQDHDVVPEGTGRVERPRSLQQNPDADPVVGCTR